MEKVPPHPSLVRGGETRTGEDGVTVATTLTTKGALMLS
jgi:hypothetical protein